MEEVRGVTEEPSLRSSFTFRFVLVSSRVCVTCAGEAMKVGQIMKILSSRDVLDGGLLGEQFPRDFAFLSLITRNVKTDSDE